MIGYAMLYAVAVSIPLALAALVVARFLQRHGRPERMVWMLAIAATLLVPAFMLSRPPHAPSRAWMLPIPLSILAFSDMPALTEPTTPTAPSPMDPDALLLLAWGLVSMVLILRWIVSAVRLRRLIGSWLSDSLDGVPVWLTSELGPAVTGVLRPRVVMPAWATSLPADRRALVLLHEQEHVRARDPLFVVFARLTRIATPWNPVSWLLASNLERAVELDCDRRVLRWHPNVEAYGETLLVVSARGSSRLLSAAAFAETDVPLRKRILAMTTPPQTLTAKGVLATVVGGALMLTGVAVLPAPALRIGAVAPLQVTSAAETRTQALDVDAAMPQSVANLEPARMEEPVVAPAPARPIERAQQPLLPEPRVIGDPRRTWLQEESFEPPVFVVRLPQLDIPLVGVDMRPFLNVDSVLLARSRANASTAAADLARLADSVRLVQLLGSAPVETFFPPRVLNPQEIIHAITAAYPASLRERGLGGTVGMQFLVGATGEVQDTRIGQISAFAAIDEAARSVAEVYRFSPAYADEEPVAVWVVHAIDFRREP